MRVKDRRTGEEHLLTRTNEISEALGQVDRKFECLHEVTEVRVFTTSNGGAQIKRQCVACGHKTSNPLPKGKFGTNHPPGDLVTSQDRDNKKQKEREDVIQAYLERHLDRVTDSRKQYDAYLLSQEWMDRRQKVMKRSGGVCEGCLEHKATQVHHLTYDNFMNEFMFELVAMCDDCHNRVHRIENSDSENE